MAIVMNEQQKAQIVHYLTEFTALANKFFMESNYKHQEYWKGQVMGICHTLTALGITEIDTKYYLTQLH